MITKLAQQATPLDKSDYAVLIYTYKCYFEPSKAKAKRYNKGEYVKMEAQSNSIDWEELFKACPQNVDGQYNILIKIIQEL